MKTSNLMITLSLCSLLLSSASIFGMETRKRRNDKGRTYADVTKTGIRVTQKDRTIEIDSELRDQSDTDEKSTTTETSTVTTTPIQTNNTTKNSLSSESLGIFKWLRDNVISSPGQNVLTELRQKTFEKGSTPNLRRLQKAVEEFRSAEDYRNLTELLELCKQQKIKIDSTVLMKITHQSLQEKKAEQEQELAKVIIAHHGNITTQANKQLKRLQELVDTEVKKFSDLIKKSKNSLNDDIENHGKEIRIVKQGQLLTHQVNAMFKNQIDGHNSDDEDNDEYVGLSEYNNHGILEKPTVNMSAPLQQMGDDIRRITSALSTVKQSLHNIYGIKAITEQ